MGSSDRRLEVRNHEITNLEDYSDTSLFINPEVKILRNFPEEEKYQLTLKAITYQNYADKPRVNYSFYKYGIEFESDMKDLITVEKLDRAGGKLQTLYDKMNLIEEVGEIVIQCPENVIISTSLRNEDNEKCEFYSLSFIDGTKRMCQFSPPEPGLYKAYIQARFKDEHGGSSTVYSFTIDAQKYGHVLSAKGSKFYTTDLYTQNQIRIIDSELDMDNGIYIVDAAYPE